MVTKQDIITAMQHPETFLKLPDMEGATVKVNKKGTPYFQTGGFTMVFQLTKDSRNWAFRVWHAPMAASKQHYRQLSDYLEKKSLPYFASFVFDEKCLIVAGEAADAVRLEWVEGLLLKDHLEKILHDKAEMQKLAKSFKEMCLQLHHHSISHGDLQEGNILVDSAGVLRLIDYDSMCIPEMEGRDESVTGQKGYQHPSRGKIGKASLTADYFSELVIYISILGLAEHPILWDKYKVKETACMLFTENDFEALTQSAIYHDLKGRSPLLDKLLQVLDIYCKTSSYLDCRPLDDYLEPPAIRSFQCDKRVLLSGLRATLSWEVAHAQAVELNHGIGSVEKKGTVEISPGIDTVYRLTATGYTDTIIQEITLPVYPMPTLKFIPVSIPPLTGIKTTSPVKVSAPKVDLSMRTLDVSMKFNYTRPNIPIYHRPLRQRSKKITIHAIYEYIKRKLRGTDVWRT